jgi:hypothetical protein
MTSSFIEVLLSLRDEEDEPDDHKHEACEVGCVQVIGDPSSHWHWLFLSKGHGLSAQVATAIPHPIEIDWSVLHLHPDPAGMQHDECKAGIKYVTRLCRKTWRLQHRPLPRRDPTIHDTVRKRFDAGPVLQYDRLAPYRPETLRVVNAYQQDYKNVPYSGMQLRDMPFAIESSQKWSARSLLRS